MDYLDPKKKKAHKIRLMLGYVLFAIAIGFATLVLVYLANGYYIDRSTGELIQNGLVFVDSNPQADIYLNGEKQRGKTDARLVIPAGEYSLELRRDGYHSWQRSLQLEGGSLRQLTYARLIPETLDRTIVANLLGNPADVSQSIDKRWLIISYPGNVTQLTLIDLQQIEIIPTVLELPEGIVGADVSGSLKAVEWSDDDATVLFEYNLNDTTQYVLVNRTQPALARNLTTLFSSPQSEITLRDRSQDNFFVFDTAKRLLYRANLKDGIIAEPVIDKKLIDYQIFASDWFLYVEQADEDGRVMVRLRRGDQDILLKTVDAADAYLLEIAKLGNVPVLAFARAGDDRASVYYDPEKYLAENIEARVPIATTVLYVPGLLALSISADSSVVMGHGEQAVASHEFKADRSYVYRLPVAVDAEQAVRWIDGQHYSFSSANMQYIADFDGSNTHKLVASLPSIGSFYNESIELMFSFDAAVAESADKPALPARVHVTNLLTPADR